MAVDERSRYTDERLDDKFGSVDEQLRALREMPALVAALSVQLQSLAVTVNENTIGVNARLDRMRADQIEDSAILREDNRQTNRVLLGFLSALLVAMIGCILAVIIVL